MKELGGEAGDPMPVPSMGWFAVCKDPHGNDFGLWQNDESAPTPELYQGSDAERLTRSGLRACPRDRPRRGRSR